MTRDIGPILTGILAANDLGEIWDLILAHFRALDFGAVAYIMFNRGEGLDDIVAFIERGFPPAVVETFAALGYGKHSPLLRVAMASGEPHLGSQIAGRYPVTPEERAHREMIVAAGLGETLALPLYGPAARNAAVMLAEPAAPDLFERLDWSEMQVVAQAAHTRCLAVSPRDRPRSAGLSRREAEILRWVAKGKSNGVIADILAIAPGTVDTYMRRIYEKLDVSDRTSAAVKGVGLGLIAA